MLEGYCTTAAAAGSLYSDRFRVLQPRGPGIPMSAEAGQRVEFHINADVGYTVQLMRLRSNADHFAPDLDLKATLIVAQGPAAYVGVPIHMSAAPPQTTPEQSFSDGCNWSVHFSLEFLADWRSGFYAAYCLGDDGSHFYIPFIVKPSYSWAGYLLSQPRRSKFAMLASINTWNAYNAWGGRGYYPVYDGGPYWRGTLSFERPFPSLRPCPPDPFDQDLDSATRHQLRPDLWLLTWLEENGYQIDLFTDLDYHFQIFDPADYAGLILGTHPEYWTMEMRERIEAYLHHGGRLVYLGGNGLFEQVFLDPLHLTKLRFQPESPYHDRDRCFFRKHDRSERNVLGVAYYENSWGKETTGYRAKVPKGIPSHRFFDGVETPDGKPIVDGTPFGDHGLTGTHETTADGKACGWEMDATNLDIDPDDKDYYAGTAPDPKTVVVLAESSPAYCQMTAWDTKWGGLVYSVGSLCYTGSLVMDSVLQQILRNVLDECLPELSLPLDPRVLKALEDAHRWPIEGRPAPPGPVETPESEIALGLTIVRLAASSRPDATALQLKRQGLSIVLEAARRALRSMR